MSGVEDYGAKLIMSDTVNWQFGTKYKGDKYLVVISGNFYSGNCLEDGKWYSQGTVTAFCIDIVAYAGAKSIELVGADFAYPQNHSHAKGTMDDAEVDYSNMIKVKSVDGGDVYTDCVLSGYILDIESQIDEHKDISFYNLSKNGAYIKGCKARK